jgi:acyl-CoA synthetase (AMP-forming)/AMP-acid ligase II
LCNNKIEAKSGAKLTVKELVSRANNVAVALIKRGITKSDKICVFSLIDINYTVISFATYFLGIAFVPFSPSLAYEVKNDMENLESVVIFTCAEYAKYFDEIIENFKSGKNKNLKIKSIFVIDGSYSNYIPFNELLEEGKNQVLERIPHFDVDPKKDIFQLLRSSGTTGLPKIQILSQYSFVAAFTEYFTTKQLKDLRPLLPYLSGHITSSLYPPLWISYGATVVLLVKFDEELYFQSVEKYKINLLPIFSAMGRKLVEGELAEKYDLSSVKMMVTGAAPFDAMVSKAIVEKYNVIFRERM